jgi:hypothetical protein
MCAQPGQHSVRPCTAYQLDPGASHEVVHLAPDGDGCDYGAVGGDGGRGGEAQWKGEYLDDECQVSTPHRLEACGWVGIVETKWKAYERRTVPVAMGTNWSSAEDCGRHEASGAGLELAGGAGEGI